MTRTEVLTVIAVFAIFAAIALPIAFRSRSSAKSRQVSCANNLNQIGRSLYMYSINFNRMFPQNRPYTTEHPTRPANPEHGDDDLSPLFVGQYIRDLHTFNCPVTTDNAQDHPDATPPKIHGEDIKFKRSDKDSNGNPRGTQLSYEYLGEFNPGIQYKTINTRFAAIAHDDDGMDVTWTAESKSYSIIENVGKPNHRGQGGNMLFLDGRVEWVQPGDWNQRLLDAMKEWTRVTDWHLADKDRS